MKKTKFFFVAFCLCLGLAVAGASVSGCSAGERLGTVGGIASVG